MTTLHPTTKAVWQAVADYVAAHGISPTVRELQEAVSRSKAPIVHHLKLLADRGVLTVAPYTARGIVLLQQPGTALSQPKQPPSDCPPAGFYHVHEWTPADGETLRTDSFRHGTRHPNARNFLEARAYYWSELRGCTLYQVEDVDDTFLAVDGEGRCVAQVWIEPIEAAHAQEAVS